MTFTEPQLDNREFKEFQRLIFDLAGITLADSKLIMVQGRLAKRLRALNLDSYSEYGRFLQSRQSPDEITNFINALTTNKTEFFRESHHFDFLVNTVFPGIERRAKDDGERKVRIWSSASSTGEEPYSIAMCAHDYFAAPGWDMKILATDIDTTVLEKASNGEYNSELVGDIPAKYRSKYVERSGPAGSGQTKMRDSIRSLIHFHRLNLNGEQWDFKAQFDVIFCRNVMIYFNADSQRRLIERFAKYLKPDGYLIIGHSESLFGISDRFKLLGDTIYRFADSQVQLPRSEPSNPRSASAQSATVTKTAKPPAAPRVASKPTGTKAVAKHHGSFDSIASDGVERKPIIVGEYYASANPVWISTVLGSCVSVCLYDEQRHIGGMNHFMLPESPNDNREVASFGVHAMEMLINVIMKLGGDRRRLKAKVFGGAAVVGTNMSGVGPKNVRFAEEFLRLEGLNIIASHTGGTAGMRVMFNPYTSKALVRELDQAASINVEKTQKIESKRVQKTQEVHCDVTLF